MNINEELVARFLNNECSREEAEYITAYFEAHPGCWKNILAKLSGNSLAPGRLYPPVQAIKYCSGSKKKQR